MLGLSIEGPGSRTADPVPEDITLSPDLLRFEQEVRIHCAKNITVAHAKT